MMEIDIKRYIEDRVPGLKGRLSPVMVTDISELGVAYTFTDISAGHVNQSQLTLNIIWNDYDECLDIHEKIKKALSMEEDEPFRIFGNTKFHSELSSGGGAIFNDGPQRWEVSKYYIIDWRTIHEEQ